ncbi:MAG: M3 family peptidase [Xanthobacteraceae bacterium]|nr:MAG: M3 family peptidase [Xanthobacteraceae bacterium]
MSHSASAAANPLLEDWAGPHGAPPFGRIRPEHFLPAFRQAFAGHAAEVAAIAESGETPGFDNTVAALERAGQSLTRVSSVFYNLASAHTNPELLEVETEVALLAARHWNAINMNAALFARVAALHAARATLSLSGEQTRLLERTYTRLQRAGAGLDEAARGRLAAINERLAELGTRFSHHLLADEQEWSLALAPEDLAGLPDFFVAAARAAAAERGAPGEAVITLSRSFVEPFLQSAARRDLREKVFRAFTARGDNGDARDNNAVIAETLRLREEYAALLGYPTFAAFKLADTMAKTPQAVAALLERVWRPARDKALADRDALQELIRAEGGNFALAPWDWRYYAEKLRAIRADFDDAAIKPYLTLDNMIAAAFDTAHRLFGLTFAPRADVPVWHPDVRVWEVSGADGRHVGLFYGDYFARASKRSGAWMTSLRDQHRLDGAVTPLIVNVMNFSRGADGAPALLSPDDARTLFHEMGHGLHGLLSDVTYPSLSGTSVFTDFVELPSQLYEHWQERPEVLRRFARHYQTGAPLPDDLMARFLKARRFNQGFATVEYVSSALIDLEFHSRPAAEVADVHGFERGMLARIGMPDEIALRHRPQQFGHIFSGDHYAAGYYSYMWSEVMDADAFGAFEEAGDVFDPVTAQRLREAIYASGGTRDPEAAYVAFRGRGPEPAALLRRRGLAGEKDEKQETA